MKIRNFKGFSFVGAALLALGLVTGCQSAEEADAGGLDANGVNLETEDGFPGINHDFGGLFGDHTGIGRHESLGFLAMVDANQLIPALGQSDHYYHSHGRNIVSFRVRRDLNDEILNIKPRLRFSVCGLDNDNYLDVSGISIHEGLRGVVNPIRSIEALIDESRPRRLGVIGGCASANFNARFAEGLDIRERFQKISEHPEEFYYMVRSPSYPGGICRGQLDRY